jgi:hypothetical protein
MADVELSIIVVAESPDVRDMLSELVFQCFTNYYRGNFIYTDEDDNMYSIVPSTKQVSMGEERDLTDEDKVSIIYSVDIGLSAFIEYHWKSVGEDKYEEVSINPPVTYWGEDGTSGLPLPDTTQGVAEDGGTSATEGTTSESGQTSIDSEGNEYDPAITGTIDM